MGKSSYKRIKVGKLPGDLSPEALREAAKTERGTKKYIMKKSNTLNRRRGKNECREY